VSHALTDQTSILRFIEDNSLNGEGISEISFDRIAGTLVDMFDFSTPVLAECCSIPRRDSQVFGKNDPREMNGRATGDRTAAKREYVVRPLLAEGGQLSTTAHDATPLPTQGAFA
jgi:hypothetical protein